MLPFKIRRILENVDEKQEKCKVEFRKLPKSFNELECIIETFHYNSIRQTSSYDKDILTPAQYQERSDFEYFTFRSHITNTGGGSLTSDDIIKGLVGRSLSQYARLKGDDTDHPTECYDEIISAALFREADYKIIVNKKTYYSSVVIVESRETFTIHIGRNIRIRLRKSEDGAIPEEFKYGKVCDFTGTLNEQIKDLEFIIATIENQCFDILWSESEITKIGVHTYPDDNSDGVIEYLKGCLNSFLRAKQTLEILSVHKEFALDKCNAEDRLKLKDLISCVLDNRQIEGVAPCYNEITTLKIGNLNLAVVYP